MITDLRRKFQRERAKQANDKSGPPIKRKQPLVVNLTPGGKKISSGTINKFGVWSKHVK